MRLILIIVVFLATSKSAGANQEGTALSNGIDNSAGHSFQRLGRNNEISVPCYNFVKIVEKHLGENEPERIQDFELIKCFDRGTEVIVDLIEHASFTKEEIAAAKLNKTPLMYRHSGSMEIKLSKKDGKVLDVLRFR